MEAINRRDTLTFNEVFIDGTKLEANANKYTFVWRKAVQKRLDTLPSKLAILKQDIWNELGLDTHCMNDECIYTFLAKEIHRGNGNVHKMLYLLAMGFNLTKLHNRIQAGRVNTTLFTAKETA